MFYSSVLLCELIPRESRRGRSTLKGGHVMQESISPGKARSSSRGRSEPRELSVVDNRLGRSQFEYTRGRPGELRIGKVRIL